MSLADDQKKCIFEARSPREGECVALPLQRACSKEYIHTHEGERHRSRSVGNQSITEMETSRWALRTTKKKCIFEARSPRAGECVALPLRRACSKEYIHTPEGERHRSRSVGNQSITEIEHSRAGPCAVPQSCGSVRVCVRVRAKLCGCVRRIASPRSGGC